MRNGPKLDMGLVSSSRVRSMILLEASLGGWTMNWRGMVMRCGEHWAHTTRPHFLQWCFRNKKVNCLLHTGQCVTSASGCHGGKTRSPSRLHGAGGCEAGEYEGGGGSGRSRSGAGDGDSTMGFVLEPGRSLVGMVLFEGRRMGDSAVVRRLLRSLAASVGGGGRAGRASGEDDDEGSMLGAV